MHVKASPLADRYPEKIETMTWLFRGAIAFFLLGILWPLITIKKHVGFWIFSVIDEDNTVSLASGLWHLLIDGHFFLFVVILLFSVLFPVAKLTLCGRIWFKGVTAERQAAWTHWLAVAGKWSMLDVLVVSLLVVILKLGDMVAVQVHLGVLFFAASVILSMLITAQLGKCLK